MLYRVFCILSFNEEDEARDFYHDIEMVIPKANPLPDDSAHYHRCPHAEPHPGPCEVIAEWHPS